MAEFRKLVSFSCVNCKKCKHYGNATSVCLSACLFALSVLALKMCALLECTFRLFVIYAVIHVRAK